VPLILEPKQDVQTVTPAGESVQKLIEGVILRPAMTLTDERGTLVEILRDDWQVHPAPINSVYQFTIHPGKVKGWHVHHLHDDRIFISQGMVKVVLYDNRPTSPTYGLINEVYRSEHERNLMVIPAYVFHAHQNIGPTNALLISMPTRLYNHAAPDVHRLPLENDLIPYKFEHKLGW
jgi:dTDP-4-dehydrorhamnose 3,5-epimerase